jgi:hypothetical protein
MARPTMFKICFVIAALSCIGVADSHAASSKLISAPITIGGGTFSPSNKVNIIVAVSGPAANCSPTNATNPCQVYSVKSKHTTGDRVFATNSTDPKIYYKTVPITADTSTYTANITEVFTDTKIWTAM